MKATPALVAILLALAGFAVPGCAVQRLDRDKAALAAGDYAALADAAEPCTGPAPECRQAQAIRAEACRALGRLTCAVPAYRAAAGWAAGGPGASRVLLQSLGNAAMQALAEGQGDPAENAAAALTAAEGLRRGAPADPEGCHLAGSAQLTLALLLPPGEARCLPLMALPAPCRGAAPVPGREAQSRLLASALEDQRRAQRCSPPGMTGEPPGLHR